VRVRRIRSIGAAGALLGAALAVVYAAGLASAGVAGDAGIAAAICPVVYPLDESAAERGGHYTFYGNAFFIDEDGYLVTAAHVLSDFRDGGQPHILLRRLNAPPRVIKVEVLATDAQHDIAILRAVPNPFEGNYAVAFLRLGTEKPTPGTAVVAEALRPWRLKDPHTFDAPREERSPAGILQYTATKLENGQAEAELFLFDHQVERGQSGAPVIARETQEVLGIVEGQWLRGMAVRGIPTAGNPTSNIGAAVPIVYALPLLEKKQIPWHTAAPAGKVSPSP
jgi:S1-C subfamily serine protease